MLFVFFILSLFNKKIKDGFKLRKLPWPQTEKSNLPVYWFHVSSGEFEYAKPLIRELKKISECKILVTYFSPSVVKNIQNTPEVDYFCPSPWDFSWSISKFIKHFNPSYLALARTDLWPQMLLTAKKNKIPTLLFSATLPSHSARVASFWARLFYSLVIENLDHISCVTTEDEDNFKRILASAKTSVDGDTRFDQVFFRLQNSEPPQEIIKNLTISKNTHQNKKVFIAGSTWPEDEQIIIPALVRAENIFTLLVPHEVNKKHLDKIKLQLEKLNIPYVTYAELLSSENQTQNNVFELAPLPRVIIVDKVGILASLYSLADFAFIGGSFKKSVHSVMEAAASGCYTLVGPYHYNNREALLLKSKGYLKEVSNADEIKKILKSDVPKTKTEIIDFCKSQAGVSRIICRYINNALPHQK